LDDSFDVVVSHNNNHVSVKIKSATMNPETASIVEKVLHNHHHQQQQQQQQQQTLRVAIVASAFVASAGILA
jgi:stress-induced morphogen